MPNYGDQIPNGQHFSRENAHPRTHMGTASSDSEYLPLTRRTEEGLAKLEGSKAQSSVRISKPKLKSSVTQYNNYLQVPKRGRQLFVSEAQRQRQRTQHFIIGFALLLLVLLAVWFFVLR